MRESGSPNDGSPLPGPTRWGAFLMLALLAGACDVPTEMPWWEARWIVPGEDTGIGVDAFLPDGMTVSEDGTSFLLELEVLSDSRSLGQLCPPCIPLDGQVAPKPPFEEGLSALSPIPPEIEEAVLEDGILRLEVENGFNFDPIRPGPEPGFMEILVRDGSSEGRLLADTLMPGATDSLPPGTVKVVELALAPGPLLGGLFVEVILDSPLGDEVEIRIQDSFEGRSVPEPLRVASALIHVAGMEVTLDPTDLDVEGLDQDLVARVLEGGVDVSVENPYDVTLDMELRIQGPGSPDLVREITIVPGASTVRLDFSGSELRSFLGRPGVVLRGAGNVREDVPAQDVTPDQEVVLRVTLDLILRMGAEP